MSKKYSPSGYQIIKITIPIGYVSGTEKTAETEDEKLLLKILNEPTDKIQKPILLTVFIENDETNMYGFATRYGALLSISTVNETGLTNTFVTIGAESEETFKVWFTY